MALNRDPKYSWKRSREDEAIISRPLTNLEHMFVTFNDSFFGQNSPFLGCTVSIQTPNSGSLPFKIDRAFLQTRAEQAFQLTRWSYPVVACKVVDGKEMVYNIQDSADVQLWAARTVHVLEDSGGWLQLRKRLSRETQLPTADNDCFLVYIICHPGEFTSTSGTFDVLIHCHHVLVDASAVRTVLNEFLTRLANPSADANLTWGGEVTRLYPASIDLASGDGHEQAAFDNHLSDLHRSNLRNNVQPKAGLPLYRPDILVPSAENKGTSLVAYTFDSDDFLMHLLQESRSHGAKLTAVLQAAFFQAVYEFGGQTSKSDTDYNITTLVDLRNNNYIVEPFNARNYYAFCAVGTESIKFSSHLLEKASEGRGFWELVKSISSQFTAIAGNKGLAHTQDKRVKLLISEVSNKVGATSEQTPTRPETMPLFSADLPGERQLDGLYPMNGDTGATLELDSYQLSTDQNWAKVTARSHSWKGILTICLVFNMARNPEAEMERLLTRWREILVGLIGLDAKNNKHW